MGGSGRLDLPPGYLVVPITQHENPLTPGATFALSRPDGFEVCYFTSDVKQYLVAELAAADQDLRLVASPYPVWSAIRRKVYAKARSRQLTAFEALYRGTTKAGA